MSLDRSWRSNFGRANAIALIVNAPKALWHELGTNHIPPRPFLSIAAMGKEREIREMMGRMVKTQPTQFDRIITSWDTASTLSETSDWSVGTVWGAAGLDFYLLDVFRERLESPELRRAIIDLHTRYHAAATLIEETELGRALAQDLYRTGHLRAITLHPERDKLARLLAQAARFEAGQVHVPENAPWLATYLNELLGFPNTPHDDQVDSTSQALNWLTARTPVNRPIVRQDPRRRDIVRRDIHGGERSRN